MNRPNEIVEFTHLQTWIAEVKSRNLHIIERRGRGEDPYTHYYAAIPNTHDEVRARVGYFGDANGADANFGILAPNNLTYDIWQGQ